MSKYRFADDFCDKCLEWSERSGAPTYYITGPLMVMTGGYDQYQKIGGDEYGINGTFSVDQMRDWFHRIIDVTGMFDVFLVFAAIRTTEAILVTGFESYGGEKEHYRKMQAEFRATIGEQGLTGEEAEKVEAVARGLDPAATGSLEEMKQRRAELMLWREIMNPIIQRTRFRQG